MSNDPAPEHDIVVNLGPLLATRGITLAELANRVGITTVNLSNLKNGHARAIRFTTLTSLCRELDCTPGDLLSYQPSTEPPAPQSTVEHQSS